MSESIPIHAIPDMVNDLLHRDQDSSSVENSGTSGEASPPLESKPAEYESILTLPRYELTSVAIETYFPELKGLEEFLTKRGAEFFFVKNTNIEDEEDEDAYEYDYDYEASDNYSYDAYDSSGDYSGVTIDSVDDSSENSLQTPGLENIDRERARAVITFKHSQNLPADLPQGYCYMGGVCRSLMFSEMGAPALKPRDLDIVAIKDLEPDDSLRKALSLEYMPDDSAEGHPIGLAGFEKYINERDFTINELLVHGEDAYATPEALIALNNKTVRPTQFEESKWWYNIENEHGVKPKLAMKALRFVSEIEAQYGEATVEGIKDWNFRSEELHAFFVALQLERALDRGDYIAQIYYHNLVKHGTITPVDTALYFKDNYSYTPPLVAENFRDLAYVLNWKMVHDSRDPFEFRHIKLSDSYIPDSIQLMNLTAEERQEIHYQNLAKEYLSKHPDLDIEDALLSLKVGGGIHTIGAQEEDWDALRSMNEEVDKDTEDMTPIKRAVLDLMNKK